MKKYIRRLFVKVQQFLGFDSKHDAILKDDSNYQKIKEKIVTNDNEFNSLIPLQEQTTASETELKADARVELEKHCLQVSDLLISYGGLNDYLPFKNLKGFDKSKIETYADIVLLDKTSYLEKILNDNTEQVVAAGITEEMQTALKAAHSQFNTLIRVPKELRSQNKQVTQKINALYSETQYLLHNILFRYMRGKYAESNPKLFLDFDESISLDADHSQTRAVMGVFINKNTEEALSGVMLTIDDEKPIRKKSKSGHFFIQKLKAGTHKLRFELEGFKTHEIEILHIKNRTNRLIVELEPSLKENVVKVEG